MRSRAIVGVVVAVLVVGGVGAAVALSLTDDDRSAAAPSSTTAESPAVPPAESPEGGEASPAGGTYIEYSDAALAAAEGTPVLFFHAPWCPQCRALEEDIIASGVPDGVTILKVDYDSRQDLRQQHGVTLQTTLVALDGDGEATVVFVAYDDPTLASSLAGLGLTG